MHKILEVSDVTKKYDTFTLNSISFDVDYGQIIGLVGENGAGKTTLISIILNQIRRDAGSVRIFGLDNIMKDIECKRDIGFVVDECCFHSCLTPRDVDLIMSGIYRDWNSALFASQLEQFRVPRQKIIREFSKGMKSKMMLSVALAHHPKLLILDEVTSGLDPVVRDDILMTLKAYVKDNKASVLFSTHVTEDLDKAADGIAFLHEGKLVFYMKKDDLRERYATMRFSDMKLAQVPQEAIIRKLFRDDQWTVLVKRQAFGSNKELAVPSIDEIMLMYIKGSVV